MVTFYLIGAVIAFLLGCRLIYNDKEKDKSQYGMIAPLTLLSWISVILVLWKLRHKL